MSFRLHLKWWLFPGLNLHARLRRTCLPRRFGRAAPGQARRVLDAGCGNGMLSYESWKRGNTVLGVSLKEEIARDRDLFNRFLGIPESRLGFREGNLHDIRSLHLRFDEIICSEVIEHIVRDADILRAFSDVLKPGGSLHLCVPNAEHPHNAQMKLDPEEKGGHVRPGYTPASLRALVEPAGFRIVESAGLGGPVRQFFNHGIVCTRHSWIAALWFLAAQPFLWLDGPNPTTPYSLYVRAVKETP